MIPFHGLSAFPITPADEDGRVDVEAYGRLLERLVSAGVDSIGLLGSTGAYAYLSRSERRRAVEAAAACVAGRVPLVVGVSALRTDDAITLARHAEDAGADGLLLAPMSYTPLTDEEVHGHFAAVAGATALPVCIYNNPATTHFIFSEALIVRLAGLANVRAVKMPMHKDVAVKVEIERLRRDAPDDDFAIGYSGDWGACAALLAGADAWHSVAAGLIPEPALRLTRAARSGDGEAASRMDRNFQPLWALMKEFGSIRVMYAGANLMALTSAIPPLPLRPIPTADLDRVEAALSAACR